MKEMLKRAFRTFLQAAIAYIAANIIYIVSSSPEDFDYMKNTLMGLLISAAAAGLSAVMNAPRKSKSDNAKAGAAVGAEAEEGSGTRPDIETQTAAIPLCIKTTNEKQT